MGITDYIQLQNEISAAASNLADQLREIDELRDKLGGDDEVNDWTDYDRIESLLSNIT